MRRHRQSTSRRCFLHDAARGLVGGVGGLALVNLPGRAMGREVATSSSRVTLAAGESRGNNILEVLRPIESQIRQGLARKKRVIIKPNMVTSTNQLAASHADCIEAILDFLKPLYKDEIIIAESSASGPAVDGYANYGYERLKAKYNVRLVDLDKTPTVNRYVIDEMFHPRPARFAKLMLDPDAYIISSAVMKTHDRVVATLSLKNIAVGSAIKDPGFKWGRKESGSNDKIIIHGGRGDEGLNYNLFRLSQILSPDLAVIDGFEGMEGNGPVRGTAVDHKVALASTDWLAADRVGVELMGLDFAKIGYLSFCARAGPGQSDLSKIEVIGATLAKHHRVYRPADNIEKQYKWMTGR